MLKLRILAPLYGTLRRSSTRESALYHHHHSHPVAPSCDMPQMILPNPGLLDNTSLSSPASSLCGNPNPHWVTPAQPPLNGILRNSLSRESPPVSTQSSENGGKVRHLKTQKIIPFCSILPSRLCATLPLVVVLPECLALLH